MTYPMGDETQLAHAVDETVIVANEAPTMTPELAWSDYDDEYPDTGTVTIARVMPAVRWMTVLAAVLLAGISAVWFGMILYRDEKPVAKPPAVTHAPIPAPTPKALPPSPPPVAAPDPPHAPAKRPWVAIAVAQRVRPNGGRSVSPGYGFTQDQAVQSALFSCQSAGNNECDSQWSMLDACIAIAVGAHGEYGTASGATRSDAVATARANAPWATAVQPFCSWDANNVPAGP
jgi:hypothetical protein